MSKELTFSERCEALHDAAMQLKTIASLVALEAERMAAAEKRFAERDAKRNTKASR